MRALVTGCAGFIGSHLTESLLDDGHEVVGVDCFNDNYGRAQKLRNLERARSWDAFDFVPIDLARGDLGDLIDDCGLVFHFAAEPGVRGSWGAGFRDYVRNNVEATQHILEAARAHPETRVVHASSSSIYGDAQRLPTPEATIPQPLSPYGVTKLAAENLVRVYHHSFGVDAVTLRLFSVYGPRQRPDMACHVFACAILDGQPIHVHGDGRQTRDLVYVDDVVAAARRAGEAEGVAGETYNVAGGSPISLNDIIGQLGELAGRLPDVVYGEEASGDVRATGADTTRARAELGFAPMTSFEAGLRSEWEWLLEMRAPAAP